MDTVLLVGMPGVLLLSVALLKRRFGPLALALGAGAILGPLWAGDVATVVGTDLRIGASIENYATVVLILLPALPLIVHGPKVHSLVGCIVSSAGFVVLAAAFVYEPLRPMLVVGDALRPAQTVFESYRPIIITVALVLGLVDTMLIRSGSTAKHEGKRH